jgi:hypothetical protein
MKRNTVFVGLLVAVLSINSFGFAYAEGSQPSGLASARGALVKGMVTGIDGGALTLQTEQRGTLTVKTGANTKFGRAQDTGGLTLEKITLADIKTGDVVTVRGRFVDDKTLEARAVLLVPADRVDDVRGKVTAIDGSTISVETRDGKTIHILTSAETRVRVKGKPDASVKDVEAGMLIGATGKFDADGALVARRIIAGKLPGRNLFKGGPIAGGKVSSAQGSQFVITYPNGSTVTITTDASTLVIAGSANGPALGSLSDVKEGSRILALGVLSQDGSSLAARVILVGLELGKR